MVDLQLKTVEEIDELLAPLFSSESKWTSPNVEGKENKQNPFISTAWRVTGAVCQGKEEIEKSQLGTLSVPVKRRKPEPDIDRQIPMRKRKFPGPAGILPKLVSNQSVQDLSPDIITGTSVTPKSCVSPQEDTALLCSQSTEDLVSDTAWCALVTDLGDETLLKKYSLASILYQAGKRQLHQGKATLVFGRIETMESHGSEASITLRDQSGRMQGTVHRDLLKDHEADLHTGTVLVLKQVSIISLSNKNHYLNITPNNVVAVYHCRGEGLQCMRFHSSQDSLQSVLSALEKKALADSSSMNSSVTGTPVSLTGVCRLSRSSSVTGALQLFNNNSNSPSASSKNEGRSTPLFNTSRTTPKLNTPQLYRAPASGTQTAVSSNVHNISSWTKALESTASPQGINCRPSPHSLSVNPTTVDSVGQPQSSAFRFRKTGLQASVPDTSKLGQKAAENTLNCEPNKSCAQSGYTERLMGTSDIVTDLTTVNSVNRSISVSLSSEQTEIVSNSHSRFGGRRTNDRTSSEVNSHPMQECVPVTQRLNSVDESCRQIEVGNVKTSCTKHVLNDGLSAPNIPNKSKWKFRSPPSRNSPVVMPSNLCCSENSLVSDGTKVSQICVPNKNIAGKLPNAKESNNSQWRLSTAENADVVNVHESDMAADLWEDDLGDELLSQLTEDLP